VSERAYRMIEVSDRGAARVVALKNPARKNAIGPAMANELLYALEDASCAAPVRARVLSGGGDAVC
jgi:enoyl-CoA hydratase/carnithine racemase